MTKSVLKGMSTAENSHDLCHNAGTFQIRQLSLVQSDRVGWITYVRIIGYLIIRALLHSSAFGTGAYIQVSLHACICQNYSIHNTRTVGLVISLWQHIFVLMQHLVD